VPPEKDYSVEPECIPFNINSRLLRYIDKKDDTNEVYIYEDANKNYHIFNNYTQCWNKIETQREKNEFGLITESDSKKTKQKKSENSKWILDKSVSYSDTETECIKIKGIFMMYSPDLNTDCDTTNESRYPKGRTRLYRRGRCHGNWNLNKTNGFSNFTDIRIDYKSKKIGDELGITWNKDIPDVQTNDLCEALKGIIKKINSELQGDTSTSQNKKLYEIALKNNIYVPDKRLPSNVKKEEQEKKIIAATNNQIQTVKNEEIKEEPKINVLQSLINFKQEENIIQELERVDENVLVNREPEIEMEEKNEIITTPTMAPIAVQLVEEIDEPIALPILEEIIETVNIDLFINDVVEETQNIQEMSLENVSFLEPAEPIKPQLTKVSETIHVTINVKEGRNILNNLKMQTNSEMFSEDIIKIVIVYCDRCASDQIILALNYMTHIKRIDFLLELINLRYDSDKEEILCGSKLNAIFMKLK
jgi:hypothetical protein